MTTVAIMAGGLIALVAVLLVLAFLFDVWLRLGP